MKKLSQRMSFDKYQKAADFLTHRAGFKPEVGLILGSALGSLSQAIKDPIVVPYSEIPNFLESTVESHAGQMIMGELGGKNVICMSGRFHYYEGYDFEDLSIPIRVLGLAGIQTMILTNAAGAINESYVPGDIMIIKDHIKLFGASPLRGPNVPEFGPRFFDVSDMYTRDLRELASAAARDQGFELKEGVYFFAGGPQFETPAEIRAMRILGGDAVGMSTVTEAITAAQMELDLLGLSLISNMAAGLLNQPVTGEEVDVTGRNTADRFTRLLEEIILRLPER